jgi:hypothetical protein
MSRFDRALRWYPRDWRNRYGEELAALLEDTHPGGPVPIGTRLALMRAGTVERLHGVRRACFGPGSLDGVRSGSLLVLCAWGAFVVAGAGFAKFAEHWDAATPPGDRPAPAAAYAAVQWSSFVGAIVVVAAAALCLPALVRLIRGGAWPGIRRPVRRAGLVTAVTVVGGVGVTVWAHHLSGGGRHGGAWAFQLVGSVWVLMICVSIGLGAAAAVSVVRQLDLGPRALRLQGALALVMTVVMTVILGGTIAWWVSVARVAPSFLGAGPHGSPGSLFPPVMATVGVLMVAGLVAALAGARSVVRSARQPEAGGPA